MRRSVGLENGKLPAPTMKCLRNQPPGSVEARTLGLMSRRQKLLRRLSARLTLLAVLVASQELAEAQAPPPLFTSAPTYSSTNRYVATGVFQWFTAQWRPAHGPWRPLEGRANWTGRPDWWQGQIKQMMTANIDVLYVHLDPGHRNSSGSTCSGAQPASRRRATTRRRSRRSLTR